MKLIRKSQLPSPCPRPDRAARNVSIGLVQSRWHEDSERHREALSEGVAAAANAGAAIVFLPELTLSRYPADTLPQGPADSTAEVLQDGPTHQFAAQLALSLIHI